MGPGSAEEDEASRGLYQPPPAPHSSRGAGQRGGWQQEDGDGGGTPAPSASQPARAGTGDQAAPPGPEAAQQAGTRQASRGGDSRVTWMGYDRHHQHRPRAASGTVWRQSESKRVSVRDTCHMVHLPLVPARPWMAGATAPGCLRGSTWGHCRRNSKGKAWISVAGCQAVQKVQCRVSNRGFLPPDKVRNGVS